MEHTLRCNSLKCRRVLNDHAIVTTCSHIFCLDCLRQDELSGGSDGLRPICPACKIHLTNPDDVVVANLNPTEDYKTSVLSGLSPNIIMECAGRALSFWAYQATQQIVYQEHVAKTLTEKYGTLNSQLDKIIHDANSEIIDLQTRMTRMAIDQDNLKQKHEDLIQAYREKSRKALQAQEMLDRSKRNEMLGQVQTAASDAVEESIEASVMANRLSERGGQPNQRPPQPSRFPEPQSGSMQHTGIVPSNLSSNMVPATRRNENEQHNWAGFSSQGSYGIQRIVTDPRSEPMANIKIPSDDPPIQTPSTHRQRLASGNITSTPRVGMINLQANNNTPTHRVNPTGRSPLANLSGNIGFAGYGMSAGLKISNPTGMVNNSLPNHVIRPKATQRPYPNYEIPLRRDLAFGGGPSRNQFSNGDRNF